MFDSVRRTDGFNVPLDTLKDIFRDDLPNQSLDWCKNMVYPIGLHRISYPAPAPAEIRPNFYIRPYPAPAAGYEAGFDHLSMHLPHCVIGQEFIGLQFCDY